jgi:PilZ domain
MPFITGQKLKAQSERRGAERRRVAVGSWVTSLDGAMTLACQTRDASASGVRVQTKEAQTFPKTVFYLDMKDRIAYEAIVRWQEKSEAGLEFVKAYRFMDMPVPEMKKVIKDLAP